MGGVGKGWQPMDCRVMCRVLSAVARIVHNKIRLA